MHQHHGLNWLTHTEQWQFQHAFIRMTPGGLPPRSCKNNSLVHFRLEVIKLGFLDFCVFISCYSIMLLLNVWFCCVRFSSSLYSTKRMAKKNVSEITYSIHLVAADKDNVRTVQVWRKGPSQSTCMGQQGGAGLSFWVPQVSMSQFTASIHPIQWSDHGIYWSFIAALCMTGAWIIAQSARRRRLYIANCAANYSTHCRFTGCLLCNDLRLTDTPVSPIYSMRGHDLHSLGVTCIKEMPHKNAATVPLPTSDKLSAGTSGHLLVTVCARQTGGLTSRPGV